MIEQEIEITVSNWAEEDGYEVRKLVYPGRRGAPDRMFYRDRGPIFIEFKKPGERRSMLQKREGERMEAAGCMYFYCDNIQDACDILGITNRHAAKSHTRRYKKQPRPMS